MPQIAVVLSGCGVYDGTEVHEAAAALGAVAVNNERCLIFCCPCNVAALSRAGADVQMYAPDQDQAHVVDHTKGAEMEHPRK